MPRRRDPPRGRSLRAAGRACSTRWPSAARVRWPCARRGVRATAVPSRARVSPAGRRPLRSLGSRRMAADRWLNAASMMPSRRYSSATSRWAARRRWSVPEARQAVPGGVLSTLSDLGGRFGARPGGSRPACAAVPRRSRSPSRSPDRRDRLTADPVARTVSAIDVECFVAHSRSRQHGADRQPHGPAARVGRRRLARHPDRGHCASLVLAAQARAPSSRR